MLLLSVAQLMENASKASCGKRICTSLARFFAHLMRAKYCKQPLAITVKQANRVCCCLCCSFKPHQRKYTGAHIAIAALQEINTIKESCSTDSNACIFVQQVVVVLCLHLYVASFFNASTQLSTFDGFICHNSLSHFFVTPSAMQLLGVALQQQHFTFCCALSIILTVDH